MKSANLICKYSKYLALNAQVNAANIGYHSMRKYKNIDCVIINEKEIRHEMRNKNGKIETEILKIEVDNKQAIENINEQNKAINMLQKENKKLAEQGQKNSLRYQQNAAQIQKLNTARRQNIKLIC